MVKIDKVTKALGSIKKTSKTVQKLKKSVKAKKWTKAHRLMLDKAIKDVKNQYKIIENQLGKEAAKRLIEGTIFQDLIKP